MNADNLPMELLDTLHDLTHTYRSHMRAAMQHLEPDVTPNELRMLIFLGHNPLCTHKTLTDHMHADKALIARTLNLLEARGWIAREPHPEDKRSRVIRLTDIGTQRVAAMGEERAAIGRKMLQGVALAEQNDLLVSLRNMKNQLDLAADKG